MLDFAKINAFGDGQRSAFEELVCQLANIEPQPAGSVYRRVEGSGGDGGVEAYWLRPDGKIVGYQAKYFLRSKDIDWGQIEESVKQALNTHPCLTSYVIALPCDLTDKAGTKGQGKTGWQHWVSRVAKWTEDWLMPTGRTVEFIPWTKFELNTRLQKANAEGLRRYWFGETVFDTAWFGGQVNLAVRSLDERYHPADHVDLKIESLYKTLVRHETIRTEVEALVAELKGKSAPNRSARHFVGAFPVAAQAALDAALTDIVALPSRMATDCFSDWPIREWRALATEASGQLSEISGWGWKRRYGDHATKVAEAKSDLSHDANELDELSVILQELGHYLESRYFDAETARFAIIEGRAGTGKSHLLGHLAEQAVAEGRPAVLLLGQTFNDQALFDQIPRQLGLANVDIDDVLKTLDVAARASGKRGIILIDALNEGAGARLWQPQVIALLSKIEKHKWLSCILTCRSEYVSYVFPKGLLTTSRPFLVKGFETAEEQVQAAKIYMDGRGIARPSTPWLAPEFVNPLFLRSTCLALALEGMRQFPRGLRGTKKILKFYIDSVASHLGVGRDGGTELIAPTVAAINAIAGEMADTRNDFVPRIRATSLADQTFTEFPKPTNQTWLEVLIRNGLLRIDPSPEGASDDPLDPIIEVVRFNFQRFQDHLVAEQILKNFAAAAELQAALTKSGVLSYVHGKHDRIKSEWIGLLSAFAIQVPEKFGVELPDLLPGGPKWFWRQMGLVDAFADSIRWRDNGAFSDRTRFLLNALNGTHISLVGLLIEISTSIDHPWNADFLHDVLAKRSMPDRDEMWTMKVNEFSVKEDNAVGILLGWGLFKDRSTLIDDRVDQLASIVLCWLFSSSNRGIRDYATKALTNLFRFNPKMFPVMMARFKDVDDCPASA